MNKNSKFDSQHSKYVVTEHPLILDKLTRLRNKKTNKKEFQENLREISCLMAYEVFKDIPLTDIAIETPVAKTVGKVLTKPVILCPILRAGLSMVTGFEWLIPNAMISHIGIYRDEKTLQPQEYFFKYPQTVDNETALVYILDPMLATGGSALFAINKLKSVGFKNITLVSLLGVVETVKKINQKHPDVMVYVAALDQKLDEKGYIIPGLGDAGDRIFDTK